MTRWAVPEDAAAGRADVVLAEHRGVSRSRAARLLRDGRVRRGDRVLRPSDEVHPGDVLDVDEADVAVASTPPPPLPPVRFRDDHLLILAKPAGLVVHPGAGHPDGTLVDALRADGMPLAPQGEPERPGIVHRLDRDTSGLLMVACTPEAHDGLVDALRNRRVIRRYLALVQGVLPAVGRVDAPIGRDPRDRQRFTAIESGKPAVTHWEVLRTGDAGGTPVSLATCRLETGRTHQIRVHMAFAGAPVAGDQRYGASPKVAERLGLQRPFLHAAHLAFTHPVTGQEIALDEPLPSDLQAVLARLGMDDGTIVP